MEVHQKKRFSLFNSKENLEHFSIRHPKSTGVISAVHGFDGISEGVTGTISSSGLCMHKQTKHTQKGKMKGKNNNKWTVFTTPVNLFGRCRQRRVFFAKRAYWEISGWGPVGQGLELTLSFFVYWAWNKNPESHYKNKKRKQVTPGYMFLLHTISWT